MAPADRPPLPRGRPPTGRPADDRRRHVRRDPDRRAGHGEHRADAPWRLRPLASRGREARLRAGRGRRVLGLRRAPGQGGRRRGAGGGRATVLSTLRPDALPAWGWTLPVGAGTYHALFPRAWQAFEPEVLGVRLVGEQLSPVIAGDLESSALPVGVFEWWVENPGPDPLTVGIMLTWQDPVADHGVPAPAGAWHETIETHDVGGAILHAPSVLRRDCAGRSPLRRPARPA